MSSDRDDEQRDLPALGQPPRATTPQKDPDFANEHDRTAVDRDVVTDADADEREPEAPRGWSGMER
ncbi:hypothetical protein ABT336_03175 [Micromonospora sp. NPDC000207]|uniref:hypothetical protein n=1 Tax=Micromonospora sp. NPDC000207 TaxID=3154246 RepID=UPI003323BBA1